MCPVALLDIYLLNHNNFGYNSDDSYIFPNVGAKFAKVLPTHVVQIQLPITPISYDNYRKRMKNHLDCEKLREMGVTPEDYFTYSFRLGGLSFLSDDDVNPAFLQKSADHKQ